MPPLESPGSSRWTSPLVVGRFVVAAVLVISTSARVSAQTPPGSVGDTVATTLSRSALEDLPSSGTIGGLLETTIPEIISDRIEGGGLTAGSESHIGARGSSWTQTAFQFGDLDFTDPGILGASLLFLDPAMLDAVEITTAMMPIEQSAPGVIVRMTPKRPAPAWEGRAEFFSTLSVASAPMLAIPPISTLHTWNRLAASASGPLLHGRVNTMLGVAASNATRFDRTDPTLLHSRDVGGFVHVLFTPSASDEVSGVVTGRSARVPLDGRIWIDHPDARQRASDLLTESRWQHRTRLVSLTAAGGFWRVTSTPDTASSSLAYIDSIRDMPIMDAVAASQSRQRWSAVLRAAGTPDHPNRLLRRGRAGVEIEGATVADKALLAPAVAETVEGLPARIWRFASATTKHQATTASVYAAERIPLSSRITIDGGMRWEAVTEAAWSNWFPRVSMRWSIVQNDRLSGVLGLGRYGHRLPLEVLNYADPAARGADVFRWNDLNGNGRFDAGEEGPLVSRVGARPAGISEIDQHLQRPHLDEVLLGFEVRPSATWAFRFDGLTRRERQLMALVNSGAPLSAYTVTAVPDVGGDLLDPSDDQQLPVFNRRPETFVADHYVLTNPAGLRTTFQGIELSVRHSGDRFWMIAGATAGRSSGPAASRGFQLFENDDAIPGDVGSNPNASTFAQGSPFSDRSYTIKTSGTYRFAHDVRLGIVARYQDGQPFARLVLAQDLNQGAEAIRAYRNGRTRFAYTMTADVRVQVPLTVAKPRVAVVSDVFNLLNLANEVEESVVTGPSFRAPTALQPGRVLHVGVRVAF